MIKNDCGTSMVYTQIFASPDDAKRESDLLVKAVGRGVTIESNSVLGGTEIRATFSCPSFRSESNGRCLIKALEVADISVPRIIKPSCRPQVKVP